MIIQEGSALVFKFFSASTKFTVGKVKKNSLSFQIFNVEYRQKNIYGFLIVDRLEFICPANETGVGDIFVSNRITQMV